MLLLGGRRVEDEGVSITGGGEVEIETVAFVGEETELALEFVASLYVGYITTLEGGKVGIELWIERGKGMLVSLCLCNRNHMYVYGQ